MSTGPESSVPNLGTLKNISWLTKRQLDQLARALTLSRFDKRSVIYAEGNFPESAYLLLSGVARITCRNRKGQRVVVMMVAPGMIPGFPPTAPGIDYNFRCEAVTACQIGTVDFEAFFEISLGVASTNFKRLAATYLGRWHLAQTALLQLHELQTSGTTRADIARTGRGFWCFRSARAAIG